jgi:hypothetical protein
MATPNTNGKNSANKGGRPAKYKTPQALQKAADRYFDKCDKEERPYTIAGLCYDLGFEDRHSLTDQKDRGEGFSATVKRIRLRIEAQKNEMLAMGRGSCTGLIFDLKNNHGWKDKPADLPDENRRREVWIQLDDIREYKPPEDPKPKHRY